ncbi:MAG: hypothetical protein WCO02_09630 [Bacteroidota bacterium]
MRNIGIICIVFLLMTGSPSFAQDVSVSAKFDTAAMLIGDHVGLRLQFNGPAGVRVEWPVFNDTILGNIIIIGRSKIDSSFTPDKKTLTLKQELNITCFDSGFYTLPQIPFRYRLLPDTSVKTTSTGLSMLMVHTLKVDTTIAIKPIKGPIGIPLTFREILPYLLIGLAVIAIVLALVWYLKKRKKNEPLITLRPKVRLQPYEKALQGLEKLRVKKLWQEGHVKEYHSELTDILRNYIEEGFNIPALESTTYEIMEQMKARQGFSKQVLEKVNHLLQTADMVKFAKSIPLPQENDAALKTGIEFINDTARPVAAVPLEETVKQINSTTQL